MMTKFLQRPTWQKFYTAARSSPKNESPTILSAPVPTNILSREQLIRRAKTLVAVQSVRKWGAPEHLLGKLEDDSRIIQDAYKMLVKASAKGQRIPPAGEWLLDNNHVIHDQTEMARRHLPRGYSRELPRLVKGPHEGLPRVFEIADDLISHTDGRLDIEEFSAYIDAFQTGAILGIGELWALPIMLRLALLSQLRRVAERLIQSQSDRQTADQWADQLLELARTIPKHLVISLGEMVKSEPRLTRAFIVQLATRLQGQHPALGMVMGWLEQELADHGQTLEIVLQNESHAVSSDQASISNIITSLRTLAVIDWRIFIESHSLIESSLRTDPAGVYPQMDFGTRDLYRHAVEKLSLNSAHSEAEIAQTAINLARNATHGELQNASKPSQRFEDSLLPDDLIRHVGWYLIADGRAQLEAAIQYRVPLLQKIQRFCMRYIGWIYAMGVVLTTLLITNLVSLHAFNIGVDPLALVVVVLLIALLASQTAITLINWLATSIASPQSPVRMDFSRGIPNEFATVVVVPMILSSKHAVREMIDALEVRCLSNRDPNLAYVLLTDFLDARSEYLSEDQSLIQQAVDGIGALNERHAANRPIFFLFHRPRRWNPSENQWMGYERKRGKIADFMQFILAGQSLSFDVISEDAERLIGSKLMIVLDADTQLPPQAAWKLVGTMAHPLNRPIIDPRTRRVVRGHGICQPRVSIGLHSAVRSRFAWLFGFDSGLDPYTREVSDVYEDLFNEGSFIGKGIIDIEAFHACTKHRFPENTILSHDLIEGSFARSGFVSDVELIEDAPSRYTAEINRRHRWIRGDWQIAPWLLRYSPRIVGVEPNPLPSLARWKMFDNLRRSLLPIAMMLLILLGMAWLPKPTDWVLITLLLLFLPIVPRAAHLAILNRTAKTFTRAMRRLGIEIIQGLFALVFLPFEASMHLDAISKALWRRIVTHKKLLEWQPSSAVEHATRTDLMSVMQSLWLTIASGIGVILLLFLRPDAWPTAIPLSLAWLLAPVLAWWLSRPFPIRRHAALQEHSLFLGKLARRTFRYFEEYVTEKTNWLAPDNFQETPVARLAERTSPTNIGFGLLAELAAWDLGYKAASHTIQRIESTLKTMSKLDRCHGHFYNWYDTRTLAPLPPRYVSSVDSGNLAISLLILRAGLHEVAHNPILPRRWTHGLRDTLGVIRDQFHTHHPQDSDPKLIVKMDALLDRLITMASSEPASLSGCDTLLTELHIATHILNETTAAFDKRIRWWIDSFINQCDAFRHELTQLLPWGPLSEPAFLEFKQLLAQQGVDEKGITELFHVLRDVPSLAELAGFHELHGKLIEKLSDKLSVASSTDQQAANSATNNSSQHSLNDWLQKIRLQSQAVSKIAAHHLDQINSLREQCGELAAMDFAFLFDAKRRLFTIGYNADHNRIDPGYYDLLASEARLLSYLAIALGQVPYEHWFMLNRNLVPVDRSVSLISWSGSMFEYLMPMLFMPSFHGTLLDEACEAAVQAQIDYGKERGIPWGVSESGFNLVDAQFNYQYRAFGVPKLGLKRGLGEDTVIAPYASVMATMVAPQQAHENLLQMEKMGFLGDCGFYEAVDFTPRRVPQDKPFVIVQSFMAHHSGMSLLSLEHTLLNQPMQRRFLQVPELRSAQLLLQERIPTATPGQTPDHEPMISDEQTLEKLEAKATMRVFTKMDPTSPQVWLLGNGRYQVMLTDAGGGSSTWNDISLTRWRQDRTLDSWGTFIYIRDLEQNAFWSATPQPTTKNPDRYEAVFTQGKVEYTRMDDQIETRMHVAVSPEDDVEVRRIMITNQSPRERWIEVTTYAEVVLAPLSADTAHRVFSNLFVQTAHQSSTGALIATRRARSSDESPPWLFHMVCTDSQPWSEPTFETDRARFMGRTRTKSRPICMENSESLSNTVGAVLDPIVAIRRSIKLQPGDSAELDVILGIAPVQPAMQILIDRYRERHFADRVFETAWTHGQVMLHHFGASPSDAVLFNRLAGALIYGDPSLRAQPNIVARNRLGQPSLWSHAISGDLPIVLLTVCESANSELITKLLQAHAWWRRHGLRTDLVILTEDRGGYQQNLMDHVNGLVGSSIEASHIDKPGGIFVRHGEHMSEDERLLLQAVARITFSDRAGTLEDQDERVAATQLNVPRFRPTRKPNWLSIMAKRAVPPDRDLMFYNGWGGFTRDGREYVIHIGLGNPTPAPWANVLANGSFGSVVSESGAAYTWFENAHEFRLTPWHNDPVSDTSGESLYLRDETTGRFWSPTPLPAPGDGEYCCRHGQGYTVFEHDDDGLACETTMFVAFDAPVKFIVLRLRNRTDQSKRISVWGCFDWALGETRGKMQSHIVTRLDSRTGAIFATNVYNPDFAEWTAFAYCQNSDRTYTADRAEFYGRAGTRAAPAAMQRQRLSNRTGATLDPCAAMQCVVQIPAGESEEVVFMLGASHHERGAQEIIQRFRTSAAAQKSLEDVWDFWKKMLGGVFVQTPDPAMDVMVNQWTLYQTIACRIWGRSGYYQSGGAFGFRDQLQDTMALIHTAPWLLREQILKCASRQFREGDVQHWWHPPKGAGVRTHFSDDFLWLPHAVCRYVSAIGDTDILNQEIPFLTGKQVKSSEEAYYDLPTVTNEKATLYEHCVLAIRHGLQLGQHGLPLMGCGDWNDGMNRVGAQGKGESVWLAFFLFDILTRFAQLAQQRQDDPFATECRTAAENLQKQIEEHAWDGQWYRRAFFDDGSPMGSASNAECQIDSIAQSWAVISGAADPTRAIMAMNSLSHHLVDDEHRLIQLFDPPFNTSSNDPGYIKGYLPGVRENGGQYTHAAVWAAMALGQLGEREQLWKCFSYINPILHANTPENMQIYKVEPYVIAADVYTNPQHIGRGGWSWYTGSAGWFYRLMLETILGLSLEADRLLLAPRIPADWKSYWIHYRFRDTLYHIQVVVIGSQTTHVQRILIDNVLQTTAYIPLVDDKKEHQVTVEIG